MHSHNGKLPRLAGVSLPAQTPAASDEEWFHEEDEARDREGDRSRSRDRTHARAPRPRPRGVGQVDSAKYVNVHLRIRLAECRQKYSVRSRQVQP